MTGRAEDRLTGQQARAAIAAALIRQIHAIITRRVPWDADIAAGRLHPGQEVTAQAAWLPRAHARGQGQSSPSPRVKPVREREQSPPLRKLG